ncbi:TetR/AcrR family transcriptional regulator [Sporomusa acidovorans]|uniref:HTH tetR-type domain-containing protein n=1 Tax=Sporomusa acidovorans (strain ATCC 49682 / DSM 3132 / Mol) TaxID=1123286 RepID=A0ABZ3J5B4_SPOA4|nr:TetR/AcrR family transcriptional regulator [Sporomusa acidovorans]OZC16391.1 putative HTH-type transcriptional regulator YttP [Sporomusa acidovorans DSM 3132]SDF00182.1 transcriptional regulator, TetR family [Sporomusa acidovorans]
MEKDTREKLMETGERLFSEKGLSGVSIRELAREAGANSALISYHFGSKEGLYSAILEKQFSPINALLDSVSGTEISPTEKILTYARCVAKVHGTVPFLTKFLIGEIINPSRFFEPFIQKYIHRIYNFLVETLREGIRCGEFRKNIDVNTAALALAGMMNFYFITRPISQRFVPGDSEQDKEFVMKAVEIFLNGVANYGNE